VMTKIEWQSMFAAIPKLSLAFGLCFVFCQVAQAQDTAPNLRRVYIPTDRVAELGERYADLQVLSRTEFDQLVARAGSAGVPSVPRVISCKLQAVLEGHQLRGTGRLEIRGQRETQSLLRWPASPWLISDCQWESADASLGYLGNGELGLVVPAGELQNLSFRWELAARSSKIARRLEFRLPTCSSAELVLDLPRGIVPSVEQALVSGPTNSPKPELHQWSIRLSPADSVRLQLVKEGGAHPFSPLIVYEREMEAEVGEQATELLARFNVNVAHQPVRRFQFNCSSGLEVLSWSGIKVHDWEMHEGRATVWLSEPLLGAAQITVRALAPAPTDGRWQLPTIVLPDGVWSGGKTRFRTAAGLTACDFQSTNSRILGIEELSAGRTEFLLQHAVADAAFSAEISSDVLDVFASVATAIEPGARLEADTTVTWQVSSGEISILQIHMPAGWLIQDISEEPEDLLAGWAEKIAGESGGNLVTLRLNRALTPNSTLTTKFRLRGPGIEGDSLQGKFDIPRLRPVHAHIADELLTLERRPQWSAELVETLHMTAVSPGTDSEEFNSRKQPAVTYRFDREDSTGKIALHRESPEITADINVKVQLDERMAQAKYVLDADMLGGQVEWLDIGFSAGTANGLLWELPEGSRAERLDDEPAAGTAAELWRVILSKRLTGTVRLEAKWLATATEHDIPFPSIAHATGTRGRVTVTYPGNLLLNAMAKGLREGTQDRDEATRSERALNRREQSWQFDREMPRLSVRVTPNPELVVLNSCVRHTSLISKLDGHGSAIHRVRYQIQSRSGAEFTVQLPPNASLREAHSTGPIIEPSSNGLVRMTCPASAELCELEIEYATSDRGLGSWSTQAFDLPRTSLPSLRFTWNVETSSNYSAIAWSQGLVPVPPYAARSWAGRLFGPLVRVTGPGPLQLLKPNAWREWQDSPSESRNDPLESQLQLELEKYFQEVRPRDRSWARLISTLDQIAARRLVLDALAIDESGIQLSSDADLNNDTSATSLLGLVRGAELNLLRTKHGLLLTSRRESRRLAAADSSTGLRSLSDQDSLVEAIDRALLHGTDASGRFVLLSDWSEPPLPDGPRESVIRLDSLAGNFIQRFESAEELSSVSIEWVETGFVARITIFVICFALLLACCRKTRPGAIGLVACGGVSMAGFVLTIVVPEPLAAPSVALGWGFLAVFFVWTRRHRTWTESDSSVDRGAANPNAVTTIGTAGLLFISVIGLPQAYSTECQEDAQSGLHFSPVFVPYDPAQPEKAADSSRVLVPRATYDRLVQLAKTTSDTAGQVLVRSNSCSGKMAGDRVSLVLNLELEKISGDQPSRCSLPLSGMTIRSAHLNGKSCLLLPEPTGVAVELSGNGLHRLSIEALIGLDRMASSGTLELTIPPAPVGKLDFELPLDTRMALESAISSELRIEADKQRFLATLGATGQLSIGWVRGPITEPVLQSDSASLITWNSGHAEIERRINVTAVTGSFDRLVLEMDDRLMLEDVTAPGLAGYWVQPAGEKAQLLLEFQRPIEKQVAVALKLQIAAPSDGKFLIPAVRIVGSTPGTRVWAMCDESGRRLPLQNIRGLIAASTEDFLSIWGDSPPRLANMSILKESADVADMLVEKPPDTSRPSLQTQTQFRVSSARIETITQYSSQSASGRVLRHELRLPPGLHLTSVRASTGTQWRTVEPDRLIWFGRAAAGIMPTIELYGWLPVASGTQPLPTVLPIDDCQLSGDVSFWRTRDVRLSVLDVRGMKPVRAKSDPKTTAAGFVADTFFEVEAGDFAASLHMERLAARVTADVASRVLVQENEAEWIAVVDYQVSDGAIHSIELSIPDSIRYPIQFLAEGVYRRDVRRDGSNFVWTIQLEEPQWSDYRLVLQSKIDVESSGRSVVPLITPQHVAEVRQHLLVLNDTEQPINVRGDEYQAPVPVERFNKWFSEQRTAGVIGSLELVNLDQKMEIHRPHPTGLESLQPGILEQHQCWLRSGGQLITESHLLVKPRASNTVTLTLPRSATLLELQADGQTVSLFWNSENRLVVPLDRGDQVRELRVLWKLDLGSELSLSGSHRVELPRVLASDCPSVWTIHNSGGLNVSSSSPAPTDRSQSEFVLANVLVGEIERTLAMRRGRDQVEWTASVQDLQQRFASAVDAVRRTIDAETIVGISKSEPRSNLDRARYQLNEVIGRNKDMMDRAGLTTLRLRAETLEQRTSSAIRMSPSAAERLESDVSALRRSATTFDLPPGQNLRFLVTSAQGASLFLKPSKSRAIRVTNWIPGVVAGLVVLAVCVLLASSVGQKFGLAFLFALVGAVWCWKLEPALAGPVLLVIAAIVGVFAKIRRKQPAPTG